MKINYLLTKKSRTDGYRSYELSQFDATEDLSNKTDFYDPMLLKFKTDQIVFVVCCHCGCSAPTSVYEKIETPFRFCSSRCASLAIQKHRSHARRVTTKTHFITNLELYKKDEGICGICTEPVEISNASIDHIVPVSKGGTHTWDNVQLAHYKCNMLKSNKEMDEIDGPERCIQGFYLHTLKQENNEADTEVELE